MCSFLEIGMSLSPFHNWVNWGPEVPSHFWCGIVCTIHLALSTHSLCRTLCLHLGFSSNSSLCVFLSLSLKEMTRFMVEAGWRGEWDSSVPAWAPFADPQVGFFAWGRNWLSSCLGGWLTLQRIQDGSSHVLQNYFCVSSRGSNKGQHLFV